LSRPNSTNESRANNFGQVRVHGPAPDGAGFFVDNDKNSDKFVCMITTLTTYVLQFRSVYDPSAPWQDALETATDGETLQHNEQCLRNVNTKVRVVKKTVMIEEIR
jgi:hypothetical protein